MRLSNPPLPQGGTLRNWLAVSVLGIAVLASGSAWANDDQARLRQETKVSEQQAKDIAKAEQNGKLQDKRLVREGTEPVYMFAISGPDGVHLIKIDGITGDVLSNSVEKPVSPMPPTAPPR